VGPSRRAGISKITTHTTPRRCIPKTINIICDSPDMEKA